MVYVCTSNAVCCMIRDDCPVVWRCVWAVSHPCCHCLYHTLRVHNEDYLLSVWVHCIVALSNMFCFFSTSCRSTHVCCVCGCTTWRGLLLILISVNSCEMTKDVSRCSVETLLIWRCASKLAFQSIPQRWEICSSHFHRSMHWVDAWLLWLRQRGW